MIQKKVCMVGIFGTGKTSLVQRFVHSMFSERYLSTVGVKIDRKPIQLDGFPRTTAQAHALANALEARGRKLTAAVLVDVPDGEGHTGDIRWNFEKFLVAPGGEVVARFNPMAEPTSDDVVGAIEKTLPG